MSRNVLDLHARLKLEEVVEEIVPKPVPVVAVEAEEESKLEAL